MTDDPDAALVLECRSGNRQAFETLLVRYERPIFNAAYRILNHVEDATDVTQTVFMRAYEQLERYDPQQRFFSWIYRIAVNESIDVANSRRYAEPLGDEVATGRSGPDDQAALDQFDQSLQTGLMALKVEYRTLLVLKHVQDCSYEQIAAILSCPVKTVKSRLFTARLALRDVLIRRRLL